LGRAKLLYSWIETTCSEIEAKINSAKSLSLNYSELRCVGAVWLTLWQSSELILFKVQARAAKSLDDTTGLMEFLEKMIGLFRWPDFCCASRGGMCPVDQPDTERQHETQ
jgi:hypothetical protein